MARPSLSFLATTEDEDSVDTDSATPSDTGNEELPEIPGLDTMSQEEAAELIYFKYRQARRIWR